MNDLIPQNQMKAESDDNPNQSTDGNLKQDAYIMTESKNDKVLVSTLFGFMSLVITLCLCSCLGVMGPLAGVILSTLGLISQRGHYGTDRGLNLTLNILGLALSIFFLLSFILYFVGMLGIAGLSPYLEEIFKNLNQFKPPTQDTF